MRDHTAEDSLAKSNESDRESAARLIADRPLPELARALRSQADQIVEAWAGAIRAASPAATNLPSAELEENLPAILAEMADAMDSAVRHDADPLMQHSAPQKPTPFQQRYDVRALMTEDRLLRRVIIERVKGALGRPMIKVERIAMDKGIDTMLREAVMAQHGWAPPATSSSKHQAVAKPASTPAAPPRNPAVTPSAVIGTGGKSTSLEKPTTTSSPMRPASLASKAAVPVFVEQPPQSQENVQAAQVTSSRPVKVIRAVQDPSADTARDAAIAPRKPAERAAVAPRVEALENRSDYFPGAAAAVQAVAANVSETAVLRAASLSPANTFEITHEWIAVAAYYLWESRGRQEGRALQDWLQAEGEVWKKHSASKRSK